VVVKSQHGDRIDDPADFEGLIRFLIGAKKKDVIRMVIASVGVRDAELNSRLFNESNRFSGDELYERMVAGLERLAGGLGCPIIWAGAGFPRVE
jgi:hypothetical protein